MIISARAPFSRPQLLWIGSNGHHAFAIDFGNPPNQTRAYIRSEQDINRRIFRTDMRLTENEANELAKCKVDERNSIWSLLWVGKKARFGLFKVDEFYGTQEAQEIFRGYPPVSAYEEMFPARIIMYEMNWQKTVWTPDETQILDPLYYSIHGDWKEDHGDPQTAAMRQFAELVGHFNDPRSMRQEEGITVIDEAHVS